MVYSYIILGALVAFICLYIFYPKKMKLVIGTLCFHVTIVTIFVAFVIIVGWLFVTAFKATHGRNATIKNEMIEWQKYVVENGCMVVEIKPGTSSKDTCWVCKDGIKRWGHIR